MLYGEWMEMAFNVFDSGYSITNMWLTHIIWMIFAFVFVFSCIYIIVNKCTRIDYIKYEAYSPHAPIDRSPQQINFDVKLIMEFNFRNSQDMITTTMMKLSFILDCNTECVAYQIAFIDISISPKFLVDILF